MKMKENQNPTQKNVKTNQKVEKKNKKGIFKYIRLKSLIILVVILIFNSYAWFIFATKASASLQVHVSSWNVSFKADDETSSTNMIIEVGRIYPGMEDYRKVITVENTGETKATLSYEYKNMVLLGTTYEIGEEYTEEELTDLIQNGYPFKVNIEIDETNFNEEGGKGSFTIIISWPFESGDDEVDTYWGQKAYDYYETNGYESSLLIELELKAEQENSN